jgi:hypothetical protein
MQLLALGAPVELVEKAQRASLDEIEHAKLCFALASRFAGEALGPTRLDVAGSMAQVSLAEVAEMTVWEGCIGETLAALQATEQLAVTSETEVATALRRIAADEARHAELAWSFVRWACDIGGADVKDRVKRAFADALRSEDEPVAAGALDDAPVWHDHGRLSGAEVSEIRRLAKREVIAPAVHMLLGA